MNLYRLEACSVCGVVRRRIFPYSRRNDTFCEETRVWVVDFCEPCKKGYEEHLERQSLEHEAAKQEEAP